MLQIVGEDLRAKKDAGFAVLAQGEYGEFFSHDALCEVFQEPRGSRRYGTLVTHVMRRLEREANRTLVNVRGAGYRIALPSQHIDIAHTRHVKALRQKRRSIAVLEATNGTFLTPDQKRRLDDQLLLYKQHISVLRTVKRKVEKAHREVESFIGEKLQAAIARIEALEQRRG